MYLPISIKQVQGDEPLPICNLLKDLFDHRNSPFCLLHVTVQRPVVYEGAKSPVFLGYKNNVFHQPDTDGLRNQRLISWTTLIGRSSYDSAEIFTDYDQSAFHPSDKTYVGPWRLSVVHREVNRPWYWFREWWSWVKLLHMVEGGLTVMKTNIPLPSRNFSLCFLHQVPLDAV